MDLYLPVAQISMNVFLLLGTGMCVGMLAGIFGIGGGFLLTPMMIFLGIPPSVAVGTGSGHIMASSFSVVLNNLRRRIIDFHLAGVLIGGGIVGVVAGTLLFTSLQKTGQLDLLILLCYMFLLLGIGSLMMIESGGAVWRMFRRPVMRSPALTRSWKWLRKGYVIHFEHAKISVGLFQVIALGTFIGFIAGFLGIGGGFILVPALIYLFRTSTTVAIGTSQLHIVVVSAMSVMFHASIHQTVDILLGICTILGGVLGAQMGASLAQNLKAEYMRVIMALMIFLMGIKLAYGLLLIPDGSYAFHILEQA